MKAAVVQYAPKYLDVEANLTHVGEMISAVDADLLVLPELFASGYFFQSESDLRRVAEVFPDGPTCDALLDWASSTGAVLVAGLPERSDDTFYNSAVVVSPDGIVSTYRKVHLYDKEKLFFSPGDLGFQVVDLESRDGESYRLGVMICFDWYFPEAARTLALLGADVIAHPSNLVRKDCPRAMPIRALENHLFTLTANRYGTESSNGEVLHFIGQSLICNPSGDVLYAAPPEGDAAVVVEIDPADARDRQITARNDLFSDRRPEEYGILAANESPVS